MYKSSESYDNHEDMRIYVDYQWFVIIVAPKLGSQDPIAKLRVFELCSWRLEIPFRSFRIHELILVHSYTEYQGLDQNCES